MSRISDNANVASFEYAINQTKNRLEDLQIKGTNLKRIMTPSDDPVGSTHLMELRSRHNNNQQYQRNISFTLTTLEITDNALKEISEIMSRAKELAIAQSSDLYNIEARTSVSKEIEQLYKQMLGVANRRIGKRYIFSGQNTLTAPFTANGKYQGDENRIYLELSKGLFTPINIPGNEIFYINEDSKQNIDDSQNHETSESKKSINQSSEISKPNDSSIAKNGLFSFIRSMELALKTGNTETMQNLLEKFDQAIDHIIILRSQIGALTSTVRSTEMSNEDDDLQNSQQIGLVEDADVAQLFADVEKQKNILKATYKAGTKLLDEGLIQFLR